MSKSRQGILDFLGESADIERIDSIVEIHGTTYKAVYECLINGLSIEDTEIVLDLHNANINDDFKPSIRNLRILFSALGKDEDATIEALNVLKDYYDIIWQSIYSDGPVQSHMRTYFVIHEIIRMLEKFDNSIDDLKMYLERYDEDFDNDDFGGRATD